MLKITDRIGQPRYNATALCAQYKELIKRFQNGENVDYFLLVWEESGVTYIEDAWYGSKFAMDLLEWMYILKFHGVDNPNPEDVIATQNWIEKNWRNK